MDLYDEGMFSNDNLYVSIHFGSKIIELSYLKSANLLKFGMIV